MKNEVLKDTIITTLYIFVVETIFKLLTDNTELGYNILRIFLSSIILGLIISYITNLIKNKTIKNILITFICLAISIYGIAQLGFIDYFEIFMSVNTGSQLGAVKSYIVDFVKSINLEYYTLLIPAIVLIIFQITTRKSKTKRNLKIETIVTLILLIVLSGSYYGTIINKNMQNKFQTTSNKELFNYPSSPSTVVDQFGLIGYLVIDVKSLFVEETVTIVQQPLTSVTTIKNFDDTVWEKIIENEKNKTYNNLNNYFISQPQKEINDYTGFFKDKNLIIVMMESVSDIAINEEYFPTLYKLYSVGWSWKNSYSPKNTCPTGNNEFSALTSLYSIDKSCIDDSYGNNKYYESLFNLFSNKDYSTSSYHNFYDWYYNRESFHKNLGSTYYGPYKLGITPSTTYGQWPSDVELFTKAYNIFSKNEKYFSFITTVSSHSPYSSYSLLGNKYLDKFKDLDVPLELKRYLSKLTVLDEALATLVETLKQNNELDNTVIVLFGDHNPYALSEESQQALLDYDVTNNIDINKTPFVIYNSQIEPKVFEEYTSYINILPTIANLFDLGYDSRLYMGEDLLSPDYNSIVVFANGSWKNNYAYYNSSNYNLTYLTNDFQYTDEEIIAINKLVATKLQYSTSAIKSNYFNYLKNKYNENGIENPIGLFKIEEIIEEISEPQENQ